jgi:hypothetical protein
MASATSQQAKQMSAQLICGALVFCKHLGLKDADVVASTIATLISQLKTRRDAVVNRAPFDALIAGVVQLQAEGTLTDAIVNVFSTAAASPFVASVTTDMLSMCGANLPSSYDPFTQNQACNFGAIAAV